MPIVLYRVDDRLVHGQVVIGWGKPLGIGFIALVDDTVAASDWERELYRMGVPPEIELLFAGVQDAALQQPRWRADPRKGMVLTADVHAMAALCRMAPPVERVNLGGIHHKPGRTARLPYVYLTDEEYQVLASLASEGVEVTAQDLPTTTPVPLEALR
ncbi:MAG TPA: PTS sugar transporter subunit IIB [Gemmatimonadales bacterium]|jgi:PTS system mannose-specific IIB component/fructoselysine and glucoselysine-specific PTS system IIB component